MGGLRIRSRELFARSQNHIKIIKQVAEADLRKDAAINQTVHQIKHV